MHFILPGNESEHNRTSQALFNPFETNLYYFSKDNEDAITVEFERVLSAFKTINKS